MKNDFKFINKDSYNNFYEGVKKYSTKYILTDAKILALIDHTNPEGDRLYEMAEAFLHLFKNREEFEVCQKIISNWPKLK